MKMNVKLIAAAVAVMAFSGCATIVNEGAVPVRLDTVNAKGEEVMGAECKLDNGTGIYTVVTPGQATVKRAAADAVIICTKEGEPDGRGSAISRASAGMFGNIILGGGIGAIIDHSKGTAYAYPQWMRIVMGKQLTFDRSDDRDGQPNIGKEPSTAPAAPQAAPAPSH